MSISDEVMAKNMFCVTLTLTRFWRNNATVGKHSSRAFIWGITRYGLLTLKFDLFDVLRDLDLDLDPILMKRGRFLFWSCTNIIWNFHDDCCKTVGSRVITDKQTNSQTNRVTYLPKISASNKTPLATGQGLADFAGLSKCYNMSLVGSLCVN